MAIACFDQFEGLLELAKPALVALTPRLLRPAKKDLQVDSTVVVPPAAVCRARGDGVPVGLLCRVSLQGELLMLGCHRTGKLSGVRMLKNAAVAISSPGQLEITAPSQPPLNLRFDTAAEAARWAAQLQGATKVPETPRGPYSARGSYSARGAYSGLSYEITPRLPGAMSPARKASKESMSASSVGAWRRRRKARQCSEDSTKESSEEHSSLEEWVEAQTERSSRLMQVFEKEQRRMRATAAELRDRRRLLDEKSRTIDNLEALEVSQMQGLNKIEHMMDRLSVKFRKARSLDGPQYFYIGDSEAEEIHRTKSSPARPTVPKLNLRSCGIERTVACAEDVWEEDAFQRPMPEVLEVELPAEAASERSPSQTSEVGSWKRLISLEDDSAPEAPLLQAAEDEAVARTAWNRSKSFPPAVGSQPLESAGRTEAVHWVIPEPMPEEPVEDSELQVALSKRLRQVESSHCEFTKEGRSSHADVTWTQSLEGDVPACRRARAHS